MPTLSPKPLPEPLIDLIEKSQAHAALLELRRQRLQSLFARTNARLIQYQWWRLTVGGIIAVFLVFAAARPTWTAIPILIVLFLAAFIVLVIRTRRFALSASRLQKMQAFLLRQENRQRGRPAGRESSVNSESAQDFASLQVGQDLGLFGSHSLWSLLDETITFDGERELLTYLAHQPQSAAEVKARQELIRTHRRETWFYTRLTLLVDREEFQASASEIKSLLKNPMTEPSFARVFGLTWALWLLTMAAIVMKISGWEPIPPGYLLFAFAMVNLGALARGGPSFGRGVGLSIHLETLQPVFAAVEKRAKVSQQMRERCPTIHREGPSQQARRLMRVLTVLGVSTNPLLHLLINAILPWSSTGVFWLERIRRGMARSFPESLRELAQLEVLGSCLIFDRYQSDVYPHILDSRRASGSTTSPTTGELQFRGLFHPLIDRTRVVANDFMFPQGRRLGLLTGSNMSGKSTFLRTVGLNQLLANSGLPVFAQDFHTRIMRIETCIEVSDSLRDGFSYFYSEVRRIKQVLSEAGQRDGVLFLIDEIFRGTNNRERQIGSRAVIQKLARSVGAEGFISTHDLELAALEGTESSLINLHFREEIIGDKMVFPYMLKSGPCPTTNALRIMEMEGIELL
jgi:hypothetical protein